MFTKLLIKLYTAIAFVGARCLYSPVSKVYRFLFERKYTKMPISLPWSPERVLQFFQGCTWKSDAAGGLIDVISKPEKFYETKTGDCDEYAIFACETLDRINCMLSVVWFDPKAKGMKKFQGHNVCMYMDVDGLWHHIGNWGVSKGYEEHMDLIKDIVPAGCIPCVYSLRNSINLRWITGGVIK
jgi:hypothetical protein